MNRASLPHGISVLPPFSVKMDENNWQEYEESTCRILHKCIPSHWWLMKRDVFLEQLPCVHMEAGSEASNALFFFVISPLRERSFPFFYEMMSRWIIPGKRLPIIYANAMDFALSSIEEVVFTVSEVVLYAELPEDREQAIHNFPLLKHEILIGTKSTYFARRILDMRGMSSDQKVIHIHEHVGLLANKLPAYFDKDVFYEMQYFLVLCPDAFKEARSFHHLSRLVSLHYLFRRRLKQGGDSKENRRRLHRKIFRTELDSCQEKQSVVGIFIGVEFIREKEIFEEKHFVRAIKTILPDVQPIPNSFFLHRRDNESFGTLYIEITHKKGREITSCERRLLHERLAQEIENRIEHLIHPVFMPRNEEEIMRNMLVLSSQLRYVRDIPQVFISFDEQTDSSLFYTVIVAHHRRKETRLLQESFTLKTPFSYVTSRRTCGRWVMCGKNIQKRSRSSAFAFPRNRSCDKISLSIYIAQGTLL